MKQIVIRALTAVAVLGAVLVSPSAPAHAAGQLYQPYCNFKASNNNTGRGEVRHTTVKGVDAWLIGFTQPPRATYLYDAMYIGSSEYCQIGKTLLVQQFDGNLVVYDEYNTARWASSWFRISVMGHAVLTSFQSDGNLVQYDAVVNPLWASNTQSPPLGCGTACLTRKLAVQADGNVVIYDGDAVLWETKTYHHD